jgi:hydrogenase expression/formation protein HypE
MKNVTLAQGSGGVESNKLINEVFFSRLKNDILLSAEDAAVFKIEGKTAFTTDSFIVSPIFFAGGDIGKIAVCGSCNDLAMMGAKPKYLSLSLIIEEGFLISDLERIADSIAKELAVNGALVVTGDTKIAPRGSVDKIFINTSAVGEVLMEGISCKNLQVGDKIIISRSIGEHGAAIFSAREGIELVSSLKSDCASMWPTVEKFVGAKAQIVAMRDATRGGVAAVLNEWCSSSGVSMDMDEDSFCVLSEVSGVCELLGFEPFSLANEGTFVMAVRSGEDEILDILHGAEFTKKAAIVGEVVNDGKNRVILKNSYGTKRILEYPTGELLPRIC